MPGHKTTPSLDAFISRARVQGRCVYVRRVPPELRKEIDQRTSDPRFNAWQACTEWLKECGVRDIANHHVREHYRRGHDFDV